MRRQSIQAALGMAGIMSGRKGRRGALDALFNRGARGERRRQRMLAAGAAPSIAEQEGTAQASGVMESSIGAAGEPQQNPNSFSQPQTDLSLMDPRIASRAPKPVEPRRAAATLDYASGGRGTFIGNALDPYRMGSTGTGTFMDGRGSLSTRGRGMLVGGVDARHQGLTEEQVNSNRNFTNLFSSIGQY